MIPATAATPVVIVPSVADPAVIEKARKYGAREIVEKPFSTAKLREIAARYLSRQ